MLIPFIFKRLVDSFNGIEGIGPEDVKSWAMIYVLFGFTAALLWRASGFSGLHWATGVRATVRENLTEYVTNHSYGFFSNRFAGAIGNKINNASDGITSLVQSFLWDWLSFFIELSVGLTIILYTNLYVGLIFVGWLLFLAPLNIFLAKKKMKYSLVAQEKETELRAQTIDILTNINAMHDYARRDFELGRLGNLIKIRRQVGMRNWSYSESVMTLNNVLENLFIGGMILMAIHLWSIGTLTAGDVILVLTMASYIRKDISQIGQRFNDFAEKLGQTKEGLTEILREHEIKDSVNAKNLDVSGGEIIFENTSFQYETHEIFKKLNFHIKPGQRVGLVGRSGAGKSTLMKLLMRQYDTSEGRILIDGQDIKLVKQESLRDSIAVVPQDPLLFHRSLKENIHYGKLSASDADIIRAAEQAQAHQFIDSLPKKYDTLVGERGVKLSGGERQRVAIARAFLKNAKILLLDEATSSLDSESESMIRGALEELMKGKTVIAIAHRLSTIRAMDRILVIDDGQIVEDGNHDELLKLGGIYAELWSHQAGGFINESL